MPDHPVVRSAQREAVLVLTLWAIACAFTLGYCYTNGFGGRVSELKFIAGFPAWVFVGIVAPWLFWSALSFVIANWVMADDDLGEDAEEDSP